MRVAWSRFGRFSQGHSSLIDFRRSCSSMVAGMCCMVANGLEHSLRKERKKKKIIISKNSKWSTEDKFIMKPYIQVTPIIHVLYIEVDTYYILIYWGKNKNIEELQVHWNKTMGSKWWGMWGPVRKNSNETWPINNSKASWRPQFLFKTIESTYCMQSRTDTEKPSVICTEWKFKRDYSY